MQIVKMSKAIGELNLLSAQSLVACACACATSLLDQWSDAPAMGPLLGGATHCIKYEPLFSPQILFCLTAASFDKEKK
jgi:hypothetical protein